MPAKKITSWSLSRYHDYKRCPLKAKLKHVDKIKEPPNEAMTRGAHIHKLAEQYIKGELTGPLPAELGNFKSTFEALKKRFKKRALLTVVEDSWGYDKDWNLCRWDDWANCWLRIKVDAASEEEPGVLDVTDWKTGKYRDEDRTEYEEQLELYALGVFLQPSLAHINTVRGHLKYLDLGIEFPPTTAPADQARMTFSRDQLPALKTKWLKLVKPMLSDMVFAPRPNKFCNWCHFRKGNAAAGGGQCPL